MGLQLPRLNLARFRQPHRVDGGLDQQVGDLNGDLHTPAALRCVKPACNSGPAHGGGTSCRPATLVTHPERPSSICHVVGAALDQDNAQQGADGAALAKTAEARTGTWTGALHARPALMHDGCKGAQSGVPSHQGQREGHHGIHAGRMLPVRHRALRRGHRLHRGCIGHPCRGRRFCSAGAPFCAFCADSYMHVGILNPKP